MKSPPPSSLFGQAVARIHCVGVGGMGLGPLAVYLARLGYVVTGEDHALTAEMRGVLVQAGVTVAALPADAELVVCSSAIGPDHPVRAAAADRGLRLVRRGEMLAEVVREKKLVAVCGSHGKTSTTAMLITALRRAGFPAGHVLGGLFADDAMAPAAAGENEWVVAEIDESDGTIERFSPELTVVVNFDWDHPDFYQQPADLERMFAALFARTRGPLLVSAACATSRRLAPSALTFGRGGDFAGEVARESPQGMTLWLAGRFAIDAAEVRAKGEFNAANATAALAAAQLMGARLDPRLLEDFPGVRRRQGILREAEGLLVIEDYAHHPAEIRALLAGMHDRMGGRGRLLVVFQPHRFSRTARFKAEFAGALGGADRLHLLDVYPAGEAAVDGGTTSDLLAECRRAWPELAIDYHPQGDETLFAVLNREAQSGDCVAFVGAGDIDRTARRWLASLPTPEEKARHWDDLAGQLAQDLSEVTTLRREEPLASKTTMRVGGAARLYAEPGSTRDLQTLLRRAAELKVPVHILGRGSNLIVPDEGVDGLVISMAHPYWATFELRPKGMAWVGAGLRLKNLCGLVAKAGMSGFEFLEGIPGNVGGGLRMNAGAMGGWMFDVVEEVRLMTMTGEIRELPKSAMHIGYRHCAELQEAVALGALLAPRSAGAGEEPGGGDPADIGRQIDVYRRKRHESQPREPSAGCIFKNPPGDSAGRLIDQSGLKGERVGDAEVSTLHANFIVNRGQASAADVLELVRRVRARVRQARGVDLQPEVLLYGRDWRDVL